MSRYGNSGIKNTHFLEHNELAWMAASYWCPQNFFGTNINNLTTGHISAFPTVDPEDEVLEKFERTLNPTFEMIATNQKQNQELTSLRDWLLPMLMNEQVRADG